MTSVDARVAAAEPDTVEQRVAWRFRIVVCCLGLAALAFLQQPGKVVGDTKLDLVVAPGDFLTRALHMWDPEGAFGQLQNQAYGYLFPMGPFFWVGHLIELPGWVVQRGWLALVMITAFLGVVLLTGALGIGSRLSRVLAGFAFALSPRFLTILGPSSVEAWPSAVAPWVLLCLVVGSRRGSPRRAAALAGLAVACVGGVNAAAAAAVLPLGMLWLLTREPGLRRRALLLWWPFFTLLGTLWWLVPLFLLGGYSPPFLDFIEDASVTTFPTTLFDALRGTSNWTAYVDPDLTAAQSLLTESYVILDVAVLVGLGLLGLARRDNPHRLFLALALLTGMVLVTAGHVGALQGWFAATEREWLDEALAPLRNVHKYDVIIRLPLVIGLAHWVARPTLRAGGVTRGLTSAPSPTVLRRAVVGMTVVALVGAASPALTAGITPRGAFAGLPGYWQQTAAWLAEHADGGRALLLPGSTFGSYVWGEPRDEPLQPLARSPWAVRNAIPLAPAGNIRMLTAVEARLASGEGSPGLAAYLARAGVGYLVVRNDLARGSDVPDPVLVHRALTQSPGLLRVADFGPTVGGEARLDEGAGPRVVVNQGWQEVYPAVEIFEVTGAARAITSGAPTVVAGGPESLLELLDLGVLTTGATVLAVDAAPKLEPADIVLTDGLRRRSVAFGRIHENHSMTLTDRQAAREPGPAREYALGGDDRWTTTARLEGAAELRASSSLSDTAVLGAVEPQHGPFAAFDGDLGTEWVSGQDNGPTGPWVELRLERPASPESVTLTPGSGAGPFSRELVVTTAAGRAVAEEVEPGQATTVALPPGRTRWLRVSLRPGLDTFGARLAISELEIPGVELSRPLVLPRLPEDWPTPEAVVLTADEGYINGCIEIDDSIRCAPGRASEGEDGAVLDRVVPMPATSEYDVRLRSSPRPGPGLDALLQQNRLVTASASSQSVLAPVGGPLAAVDGARGTTWIADRADVQPTLTLSWLRTRKLDEISLRLHNSAAAASATKVQLVTPTERRTLTLGDDGRAEFPPLLTDRVSIRVRGTAPGTNLDYNGSGSPLPAGVSEVRFGDMPLLPITFSDDEQLLGCGSGPDVQVNGQLLQSEVIASGQELFRGEAVDTRICGSATVTLQQGENDVVVRGSSAFRPESLVLLDGAGVATVGADVEPVDVRITDPIHRVFPFDDTPAGRMLVLRENANPGWSATRGGVNLEPVMVDGWQQGWWLPPSSEGEVHAEFAPGVSYRVGLLVGTVALLGLVVAALWPGRRRRRWEPLGSRAWHPLLSAGVVLVGLGMLAGFVGAVVAALTLASVRWTPLRARRDYLPWLAIIPLGVATVSYMLSPWGDPGSWAGVRLLPQLCVALTLSLVLSFVVGSTGVGRRDSRMNGRSTSR